MEDAENKLRRAEHGHNLDLESALIKLEDVLDLIKLTDVLDQKLVHVFGYNQLDKSRGSMSNGTVGQNYEWTTKKKFKEGLFVTDVQGVC